MDQLKRCQGMCYKFQRFISKRAPTGKETHEYTINPSSCIVGLKTENMWLPKKYSLPKNSNYQWINGIEPNGIRTKTSPWITEVLESKRYHVGTGNILTFY